MYSEADKPIAPFTIHHRLKKNMNMGFSPLFRIMEVVGGFPLSGDHGGSWWLPRLLPLLLSLYLSWLKSLADVELQRPRQATTGPSIASSTLFLPSLSSSFSLFLIRCCRCSNLGGNHPGLPQLKTSWTTRFGTVPKIMGPIIIHHCHFICRSLVLI